MVRVIAAERCDLVRVHDEKIGEEYPCDPKALKREYSLTRKQRIACGIA